MEVAAFKFKRKITIDLQSLFHKNESKYLLYQV